MNYSRGDKNLKLVELLKIIKNLIAQNIWSINLEMNFI